MSPFLLTAIICTAVLFVFAFYYLVTSRRDHGWRVCSIHYTTVKPGHVCPDCAMETIARQQTMDSIQWDWPDRA